MATGAAVAPRDRMVTLYDALGGHLIAGAAPGAVVGGAERLPLLGKGLKRLKFRHACHNAADVPSQR